MLGFLIRILNLFLLVLFILSLVNFTAPDGSIALYVPALPTMMLTFEKNWLWLEKLVQRVIAYLYQDVYYGLIRFFSSKYW